MNLFMHYKYVSSSWGQKQHALVKRTSQIMKNGQDVFIQLGSGPGAPDRVNIPCLMHDTYLCQIDVKLSKN